MGFSLKAFLDWESTLGKKCDTCGFIRHYHSEYWMRKAVIEWARKPCEAFHG